jgi:TRAP-type C4-dicarboxylate transport system permease small subunit
MQRILAKIEYAIAALLLATIVALVFISAIMRTLDHPVIWSIDLSQLLFIWLCFFGAVRALREKAHIGIDIVIRHLPQKPRLVLETILSLVTLIFLGLLAYEGTRLAFSNMQRQFGDSGLSYFWVTIAVPVGCVMLAIALVYNMVKAIRNHGKGDLLIYSRSDSETVAVVEEL